MAPHSSTLAWKIPWMEEPGRLQSMGSLRVGHNWATSLSLFTFHFPALEKEMATHSSVLAWRIPGMGEPGGLPSMGLHRVRHDWSNLAEGIITAEWGVLELAPSSLLPALFRVNLEQVSHLWHYWLFGLGNSLSKDGVFLMHCRMFSSIPILYILNSSGNPPIVTIKSVFGYYQMSLRAQNWLWFRTTDLESRYFTSAAVVPSYSNSWIQAALLPTLANPALS